MCQSSRAELLAWANFVNVFDFSNGSNGVKMVKRILHPRTILVVLLVFIMSSIAYGFAAANVVAESGAGDGEGDVSGYTIGNIEYSLDSSNPREVDGVQFTLTSISGTAPDATAARITVDGGTTWTTCSVDSTPKATCKFATTVNVVDVTAMRVVALSAEVTP